MRGFDKICGGVFAAAVLVFAALGCSQFDNVPSASAIAGIYDADVTGGEGKGGRFDIAFDQTGNTFGVSWSEGGKKFDGTAVYMGNYLGVTFAEAGSDAVCGTMFYRNFGPQNVAGSSAVLRNENAGSESLARKSGEGFEGEFGVYGRSVEGSDYSGTLSIKKNGEKYDAMWLIDGKEAKGIGYVWENMLAVAFGDASCRFAVYRNGRGFFQGSEVVRFSGRFGGTEGFYRDLKIEKRSSVRSGSGE